jgi:hypothetical protein
VYICAPAIGACETQAVPFDVKTLPDAPVADKLVPPLATGKVPVIVLPERLIVLLVRVSVVALPTNVSVLVGSVNVPVLLMLEIIGAVSVLLVSVVVLVAVTMLVGVMIVDRVVIVVS